MIDELLTSTYLQAYTARTKRMTNHELNIFGSKAEDIHVFAMECSVKYEEMGQLIPKGQWRVNRFETIKIKIIFPSLFFVFPHIFNSWFAHFRRDGTQQG